MKLNKPLVMCAAVIAFSGCQKSAVVPPATVAGNGPLPPPTHAQPKLSTMKIFLGAEALDAELALTPEQEETGMMFRTNILDTDSMLFILPYPQQASFWMKNCPESISAAYITPEGVIAEVHHLEKNDTTPVLSTNRNILYVLETSEGWFDRHHVSPGMVVLTERGSLSGTFFHH